MRFFLIIFCMYLLIGCQHKDNGMVVGNKLFVVEGYQHQLKEQGLEEVRTFPYFHEPFIVVAKNFKQEQLAVLYRSSGQIDTIKLPLSYEGILEKLATYGYPVKSSPIEMENVYLFEINRKMVWSYDNKGETVYLSDKGELINPFTN